MSLIIIPPIKIEISIPDLVLLTVTLKRKATLFTMTYNQATKSLVLSWIISYPDMHGINGISSYSKELIADNSIMVDVNTGAVLTPTITAAVTDAQGNIITPEQISYPGDYIGQYDWFNNLAETQPIKVHGLIRQYGLQATWN